MLEWQQAMSCHTDKVKMAEPSDAISTCHSTCVTMVMWWGPPASVFLAITLSEPGNSSWCKCFYLCIPHILSTAVFMDTMGRKRTVAFLLVSIAALVASVLASDGVGSRNVVDHVVCFQIPQLSAEEEDALLQAMWELQFTCTGAPGGLSILSLSAGRLVSTETSRNCTYALFVRYPSWDDLYTYWRHPCKNDFAQKYIIPFFDGEVDVDYEAQVPSTTAAIRRQGPGFDSGVEHLVHVLLKDGTEVEAVLQQFDALATALGPDLILQQTRGFNVFPTEFEVRSGNPHFQVGVIARVASEEVAKVYDKHPIFLDILAKSVTFMSYTYIPYSPTPTGYMASL